MEYCVMIDDGFAWLKCYADSTKQAYVIKRMLEEEYNYSSCARIICNGIDLTDNIVCFFEK